MTWYEERAKQCVDPVEAEHWINYGLADEASNAAMDYLRAIDVKDFKEIKEYHNEHRKRYLTFIEVESDRCAAYSALTLYRLGLLKGFEYDE